MVKRYRRITGGEKNELSGTPFSREELEQVCDLYIEINGKGIHENNPKIHLLADNLGRTVRSVENQLLGFRAVDSKKTGRNHPNSLIPKIWEKHIKTTTPEENVDEEPTEEFDEFKFRISSYLKNILGKELITDEFVAVFELVKNSFDAHATLVKVIFENDRITIWDDGKGMNRKDIINKWLFVAYSAKSAGVEDEEFEENRNNTYRDKINPHRNYAGAKGIGRFSADSLGSKLSLKTRKINDSTYWDLNFNWDQYDKSSTKEFDDIDVVYKEGMTTSFDGFEHGLILQISNLRTVWNRRKKLELKESLEKLINPFSSISSEGKSNFEIEVIDERELEEDERIRKLKNYNYRSIVNGNVKNFVFDILKIKTTQIFVKISEDSNFIVTELLDRGELIYRIKESNSFNYIPANSTIQVFYLNRSAKINFKKRMKIDSVNFGSVFLFNNGFRVLPYGKPEHDPFGINRRKSQGYSRYLGSREIIGSVEIGNKSEYFVETTSRDGGLIESPGTFELNDFFQSSLKKLEKYIEPILWKIKKRTGNKEEKLDLTARNQIVDFVEDISGQQGVELEDYSPKLIKYIQSEISEQQVSHFEKLKNIARKTGNEEFLNEIQKNEKVYLRDLKVWQEEESRRVEAEEKTERVEREKKELEERLELEREKNTYLKASAKGISQEAKGLIHNIKLTAKAINLNATTLYEKTINDTLKKKESLEKLHIIKFNAEKALKISKLITRANFKTQANSQTADLINYIIQYIDIYSVIYDKNQIEFIVTNNDNASLIKKFNVLELSLVLDDLISNSDKAGAKRIVFEITKHENDSIRLLISDDGEGLKLHLKNPEDIFELGITTTDGSGIGLYTVRKTLKSMKASIRFLNNNVIQKGACFEIIFM